MLLRQREEAKEMLLNWVIEEKTRKERYEGRVNTNKELRGRKLVVDNSIKACPVCKKTWERVYNNKPNGRNIMYYRQGHIPTYGKEKVVCEKCK